MFCCLCAEETVEGISIFSEKGKVLEVPKIIEKHFWFKLCEEDTMMNGVCTTCWLKVRDFHLFYEQVKKAHSTNLEKLKNEPSGNDDIEIICDVAIKMEPEISITDDNDNVSVEAFVNHDPLSANDKAPNQNEARKRESETEGKEAIMERDYDSEEEYLSRSSHSSDSETDYDQSCTSQDAVNRKKTRKKSSTSKQSKHPKFNIKQRNKEIDEKIAQVLKLSCDICGLAQPVYKKLMLHMKEAHNVKGYTMCCSKKFTRRHYLTDHIDKHLNPDRFKCESCAKTFSKKQCLDHHVYLKHQPENEKTYECPDCNEKFAKQYILARHQIIHQERNHLCEICNKGFHTLSKLKTHIKVVHDSSGNMCDICAKVIMCPSAFKRHLMDHVGVEMPRVQCDICHNWYKNIYVLTKHKRMHEEKSLEHKCEVCGKIAPTRRALTSHMRFMHTAERKFQCNICHKSFKKSINLKEHRTLHTGEVLYKCPHCPRTFNSNSNMYSHRKKVHPEEFEETRKNRLVNGITEDNKLIKFST